MIIFTLDHGKRRRGGGDDESGNIFLGSSCSCERINAASEKSGGVGREQREGDVAPEIPATHARPASCHVGGLTPGHGVTIKYNFEAARMAETPREKKERERERKFIRSSTTQLLLTAFIQLFRDLTISPPPPLFSLDGFIECKIKGCGELYHLEKRIS